MDPGRDIGIFEILLILLYPPSKKKQIMLRRTSPQGDLRSLARGLYKGLILDGFIKCFI